MRIKTPVLMMCKLITVWMMSTVMLCGSSARAHEVVPSIIDMEINGDELVFDARMILEGIMAGIDQSAQSDTNAAPEAAEYDRLRALPTSEFQSDFETFWPEMAQGIFISLDGQIVPATLKDIKIIDESNIDLPRFAMVRFAVPHGDAQEVQVRWVPEFGVMVLRQNGIEAPYEGYLEPGASSGPVALRDENAKGWLKSLFD